MLHTDTVVYCGGLKGPVSFFVQQQIHFDV